MVLGVDRAALFPKVYVPRRPPTEPTAPGACPESPGRSGFRGALRVVALSVGEMSLERTLFPEPDPSNRSGEWIQTEWAEDWLAQFAGIGYLTSLIARHVNELGPTRDQPGSRPSSFSATVWRSGSRPSSTAWGSRRQQVATWRRCGGSARSWSVHPMTTRGTASAAKT